MHKDTGRDCDKTSNTLLPGTRKMQEGVFQGQALKLSTTCKAKWARLRPSLQGAERHAKSLAFAADAGYRDCSCRSAEREAPRSAYKASVAIPNPAPHWYKPADA